MRHSFRYRLIIPIAAFLLLAIAVPAVFVSVNFKNYAQETVDERLGTYTASLKRDLDSYAEKTHLAATEIAIDRELQDAVAGNDREKIIELLPELLARYDGFYATVADRDGKVLVRSYDASMSGDSVAGLADFNGALKGEIGTYYETGATIKVSIRTGVPITDEEDRIIGAVSVGFRLDSNEFVRTVQDRFDVQSTVFLGDTRINTTVPNAVGTKMSDAVKANVIEEKKEFRGMAKIMDQDYEAVYIPLFNSKNEVFSVVFIGLSMADTHAVADRFILTSIIIGVLLYILAMIVVLTTIRGVTVPIRHLDFALQELAEGRVHGKVYVKHKDEISELADSAKAVSDAVSLLSTEIKEKVSNYHRGISTPLAVDKLEGVYKDLGDGINSICDAMAADFNEILTCLTQFSNGQFNADVPIMPGERSGVNQSITNLGGNLKNISGDISRLVHAAISGDLAARAEATSYNGDWRDIIVGLNRLLEEVQRPFDEIDNALGAMSRGDMSARIDANLRGEYANIKKSFNSTLIMISGYIDEIRSVLSSMAGNDFDVEIHRVFLGDFDEIKGAVNSIIASFNAILSDVNSSGDNILAGSSQVAQSGVALAKGASDQRESVEMLGTAMQSTLVIMRRITDNISNVESVAKRADVRATQGHEHMKGMVGAMREISDSSRSINQIVAVIEDIATQTNLLALNASVEAARAGEHGKGFGVVADQVRVLSQRSQTAAKEISALISTSNEKIHKGTELANVVSREFEGISQDAGALNDLVREAASSCESGTADITENAANLDRISEVTASNAAFSEEVAATSEELTGQASNFKDTVSRFKLRGGFRTNAVEQFDNESVDKGDSPVEAAGDDMNQEPEAV